MFFLKKQHEFATVPLSTNCELNTVLMSLNGRNVSFARYFLLLTPEYFTP